MLAQQILTILLKIQIHIHKDTVWSLNIIYNIGLYLVTYDETSPIGLPKPGSAIICQSELNHYKTMQNNHTPFWGMHSGSGGIYLHFI